MTRSETSSLLIFTRNEIEGIRSIFSKIPLTAFDEVVTIDGHSTDGTVEFLQNMNVRVIQQTTLGRGNAAIEGMSHCSGDIVVFLSADGNEDPTDISKLLTSMRDAEIAVASRFMKGGRSDDSDDPIRVRRFGNKLVTALVNMFWGTHLTDSTNGLRAIRKTTWDKLSITSPYHETEFQMSIRAAKLGLKIAEVPTVEGKRVGGTRFASTRKMAWTFFKCLVKELWTGTEFQKPREQTKEQSVRSTKGGIAPVPV